MVISTSSCSLRCFRNPPEKRVILVKDGQGRLHGGGEAQTQVLENGHGEGFGRAEGRGDSHSEGKLLPLAGGQLSLRVLLPLHAVRAKSDGHSGAQGLDSSEGVRMCQPCQCETKCSSYAAVCKIKS